MNDLSNIESDDLISRWDSLFPKYVDEVKKLQEILKSIDLKRNELLLIREELLKRNVEFNETIE